MSLNLNLKYLLITSGGHVSEMSLFSPVDGARSNTRRRPWLKVGGSSVRMLTLTGPSRKSESGPREYESSPWRQRGPLLMWLFLLALVKPPFPQRRCNQPRANVLWSR